MGEAKVLEKVKNKVREIKQNIFSLQRSGSPVVCKVVYGVSGYLYLWSLFAKTGN